MKSTIALGLCITALLGCSGKKPEPIRTSDLPAALPMAQGGYSEETTAEAIYEEKRSLDSLAVPGVYTVIGITTRHCNLSQDILSRMPSFLAARKDVVFKNVVQFSGTVTFSSKAEMRAWQDQQEGIRDKYRVDFGPKVVIYRPDGLPIVSDRAPKGHGYRFLYQWMAHPGAPS